MFLLSRHSCKFKFCISLAFLFGMSMAASAQQENVEDEALVIEEWVAASMCADGDRSIDLNQPISFTYTDSAGNNPRHLTVAPVSYTHLTLPTILLV